ncbi:hypothetical protein EDEG_00832 [Edhazardia aedis USNM 41457]|uniref:CCHC-type domain-containing protein n=1 Tax=Edhazardia aedis (strain USNM 41457) TaxID=1003232 RepID=J9DBF8_EDHAE|nr:hypothetical protein EDEG_00832 [Edhazardia aedis USNM 41457]|eukprot:EJW05051.1 hypothetical protein EDEG_00832 [Edhazardia aedis USNM 41457]
MEDACVIRRLREIWMPERFQILIHNVNPNLDEVIERIVAWEKIAESRPKTPLFTKRNIDKIKPRQTINKEYQNKHDMKKDITCYKCQQKGHYRNECPDNKNDVNTKIP